MCEIRGPLYEQIDKRSHKDQTETKVMRPDRN